ncbi:MAG: hypothetical protein FWG59_05440, partial [Betaproteobacteria bacterium]|nr:hypothetical protein [Betaproteobacteria bacterium]
MQNGHPPPDTIQVELPRAPDITGKVADGGKKQTGTADEGYDMNGEGIRDYRWVVIGDIHDGSIDSLAEIPELAGADGLIITGDITNIGGAFEAARVLSVARMHAPVVAAQIGNMDKAEVAEFLNKEGVNIHAAVRPLAPGLAVMGIGGSTP